MKNDGQVDIWGDSRFQVHELRDIERDYYYFFKVYLGDSNRQYIFHTKPSPSEKSELKNNHLIDLNVSSSAGYN